MLFQTMVTSLVPPSQVHKHNLQRQRKYWDWARSNETCLWCVRRNPEHPQACGHTLCDTCVEIFGEPSPLADSEYIIRRCILCGGSQCLTVRLKPHTAAPRVLSIDGGGPRGVIPLEHLQILQELIGHDLPVADMVDLNVGTSSGGIIALSLVILRMDVSQCKSLFRSLAKKIFSSTQRKRFLGSWLSDGLYDTKTLEDMLKDHFQPTRRLFDAPANLVSSGKVAVTASSIKDGAPFLFANYNGAAPHRAELGSLTLRKIESPSANCLQRIEGSNRAPRARRLSGRCK